MPPITLLPRTFVRTGLTTDFYRASTNHAPASTRVASIRTAASRKPRTPARSLPSPKRQHTPRASLTIGRTTLSSKYKVLRISRHATSSQEPAYSPPQTPVFVKPSLAYSCGQFICLYTFYLNFSLLSHGQWLEHYQDLRERMGVPFHGPVVQAVTVVYALRRGWIRPEL